MPNYCANTLQITGPADDVDACVEAIREPDPDANDGRLLDFGRIIPEPARLGRDDDPIGAISVAAVKAAWGTRSNCYWGRIDESGPGDVVLDFDTAWSPPTQWLYAVIERFPTLEFDMVWRELGNGEAGQILGEGGEVTSEVEETRNPIAFLEARGFDMSGEIDEEE